jgi:hypothetical protein
MNFVVYAGSLVLLWHCDSKLSWTYSLEGGIINANKIFLENCH